MERTSSPLLVSKPVRMQAAVTAVPRVCTTCMGGGEGSRLGEVGSEALTTRTHVSAAEQRVALVAVLLEQHGAVGAVVGHGRLGHWHGLA